MFIGKRLLFFVVMLSANLCPEGFLAGTLVKTPSGYVPIESLSRGDTVTTFNFALNRITANKVSQIYTETVSDSAFINSDRGSIEVSLCQKFYLPKTNNLVTAKQLLNSPLLLSEFQKYNLINDIQLHHSPTSVYRLFVENNHNFYVSLHNLLVHNFVPAAVMVIPLGIGAIEAAGAAVVTIASSAVFAWLIKQIGGGSKRKRKHERARTQNQVLMSSPKMPNHDPNDEEDEKQSAKERKAEAKRIARKLKYKETKDYKFDSHGEKVFEKGMRQISRDVDSHKGGYWKMYVKGTKIRLGTFNKNLSIRIGN